MSCVLRISGKTLDLARIGVLPVRPYRSRKIGDPYVPGNPKSKIHEDSGACFDVSQAGMDRFAAQQDDATAFLRKHSGWLRKFVAGQDVDTAQLDFGVEASGAWIQSMVLQPAFLRAAALAGVSVEISRYTSLGAS